MFVFEYGDECDPLKIFWGTLSTTPNYDAKVLMTKFLESVALPFCFFFFSALKPKFAASEKIKELSIELVMVNVEVSEKLIIAFTMFTMFTQSRSPSRKLMFSFNDRGFSLSNKECHSSDNRKQIFK